MKSTFSVSVREVLFVFVMTMLVACGPYYPQQGYIQPIYDPGLSLIYVGGVQGYYDSYHVFRPMIVVNGASGYYNSSHVFVSNAPAVKVAVQSNKPFYAGPTSSSVAKQTQSQSPGASGVGRGSATSSTQVQSKPNYTGSGSISRGSSSSSPSVQSSPSKPNYSGSGSISRGSSSSTSSSSPSSRPSYSGSSSVSRSSGSRR